MGYWLNFVRLSEDERGLASHFLFAIEMLYNRVIVNRKCEA